LQQQAGSTVLLLYSAIQRGPIDYTVQRVSEGHLPKITFTEENTIQQNEQILSVTCNAASILDQEQESIGCCISHGQAIIYGGRSAATQQLLVRFIYGLHSQNTRNNYYQRFQQFSTGTRVWFQLVIGDDDESNRTVDDIDVTTKYFTISDFRRAVKKECEPRLSYVAANQLNVYPPGAQFPAPAGTDPCDPESTVVSQLKKGIGKRFIVVAPSKQMNATGERRCMFCN
jgi:hypothetical protein